MKLAILSRSLRAYSTQRLRTAAIDRGHQVKVLDTLRFGIDLTGDEPERHAVEGVDPAVGLDDLAHLEDSSGRRHGHHPSVGRRTGQDRVREARARCTGGRLRSRTPRRSRG